MDWPAIAFLLLLPTVHTCAAGTVVVHGALAAFRWKRSLLFKAFACRDKGNNGTSSR
jgi:hypothetical protein